LIYAAPSQTFIKRIAGGGRQPMRQTCGGNGHLAPVLRLCDWSLALP
jgi:hypothetical protein